MTVKYRTYFLSVYCGIIIYQVSKHQGLDPRMPKRKYEVQQADNALYVGHMSTYIINTDVDALDKRRAKRQLYIINDLVPYYIMYLCGYGITYLIQYSHKYMNSSFSILRNNNEQSSLNHLKSLYFLLITSTINVFPHLILLFLPLGKSENGKMHATVVLFTTSKPGNCIH